MQFQPDVTISGGGSIYLLRLWSTQADEWVEDHVSDDAQFLGNGLAVEHRYVGDVVRGMLHDGLSVEVE